MALFHQHLLIKAYVAKPPTSESVLNEWLTNLVAKIDMKIVIPARSVFVDSPGNVGLTGNVGIETSHIAIHVWSDVDPGLIQMDVYSCKCFEQETVINHLKEFELCSYETMMIDRNYEFRVTSKEHIVIP